MDLSWYSYVFAGIAALAAGAINALAGGGTLITFPILTALGIPAVAANVTNTVALCPGYLGGIIAQRQDLAKQKQYLWWYLPAGALGGVVGALLLLNSGEKLFRELVPYLILMASALLAAGDPLRAWVVRRMAKRSGTLSLVGLGAVPVLLASIYGGYFGAGLSVIVLAVLGLFMSETLTELNALKQAISFSVNLTAALFFVFSGSVVWSIALVMAVCALLGGNLGGRLASRVKPSVLRWMVVGIGVVVALIYFFK